MRFSLGCILVGLCSVLSSLGYVVVDEIDDERDRIISGYPVQSREYPFQVGYIITDEFGGAKFLCGGSLIDSTHVLTAAHCIYNERERIVGMRVCLNTTDFPYADRQGSDAFVRKVKYFKIHELYDDSSKINDVAILVLDSPVPIDSVRLPESSEELYVGRHAVVVGWGNTDPNNTSFDLLKTDLTILTNEECSRMLGMPVPDSEICASAPGRDACQGDSGGPLLVDGIQVGIVSWGIKSCAEANTAGVYTRLSSHLEWIRKNSALIYP